jgi:hypothetical protein
VELVWRVVSELENVITWRLNGREVHHRRGQRFVVARAG